MATTARQRRRLLHQVAQPVGDAHRGSGGGRTGRSIVARGCAAREGERQRRHDDRRDADDAAADRRPARDRGARPLQVAVGAAGGGADAAVPRPPLGRADRRGAGLPGPRDDRGVRRHRVARRRVAAPPGSVGRGVRDTSVRVLDDAGGTSPPARWARSTCGRGATAARRTSGPRRRSAARSTATAPPATSASSSTPSANPWRTAEPCGTTVNSRGGTVLQSGAVGSTHQRVSPASQTPSGRPRVRSLPGPPPGCASRPCPRTSAPIRGWRRGGSPGTPGRSRWRPGWCGRCGRFPALRGRC